MNCLACLYYTTQTILNVFNFKYYSMVTKQRHDYNQYIRYCVHKNFFINIYNNLQTFSIYTAHHILNKSSWFRSLTSPGCGVWVKYKFSPRKEMADVNVR